MNRLILRKVGVSPQSSVIRDNAILFNGDEMTMREFQNKLIKALANTPIPGESGRKNLKAICRSVVHKFLQKRIYKYTAILGIIETDVSPIA
jgi:hypothetical protein